MSQPVEILDRTPPRDLDAEAAVVGSALLNPKAVLPLLADRFDPAAFYAEGNRLIYQAIVYLGDAADAVTLVDRLRTLDQLEDVGGMARLAEIIQSVPTWRHARHYAGIVMRLYAMRLAITLSCEWLRFAYEDTTDPAAWAGAVIAKAGRMQTWLQRYEKHGGDDAGSVEAQERSCDDRG